MMRVKRIRWSQGISQDILEAFKKDRGLRFRKPPRLGTPCEALDLILVDLEAAGAETKTYLLDTGAYLTEVNWATSKTTEAGNDTR